MSIKYFETGPIPIKFGVCFSEKDFNKEMKGLGVVGFDPWLVEKSHATTHTLYSPRLGRIIIVCLAKPVNFSHVSLAVSPAMISAGVRVLRDSGCLFHESSADSLVVQKILDTALRVQKRERKNSKAK